MRAESCCSGLLRASRRNSLSALRLLQQRNLFLLLLCRVLLPAPSPRAVRLLFAYILQLTLLAAERILDRDDHVVLTMAVALSLAQVLHALERSAEVLRREHEQQFVRPGAGSCTRSTASAHTGLSVLRDAG